MTRLIGYARVSTTEQASNGVSLGAQSAAISAECERRGFELVEMIEDGASGKSLDRTGLKRALTSIAAGEADGLIVSKLDRAMRNVVDFATLLEWFERAEKIFLALDLQIDTSTAGGRLVANVFASVAEWERATIGERTQAGLAVVRAQGKAISRPALRDKPRLAGRIKTMRESGCTYREIADTLNRDGIPTLRGAPAWSVSSVRGAAGSWKRRPTRRKTVELPKIR